MKRGPKSRTPEGAKIIKLLQGGKLTPREIAERVGVGAPAVRYYKRMLARGVIK